MRKGSTSLISAGICFAVLGTCAGNISAYTVQQNEKNLILLRDTDEIIEEDCTPKRGEHSPLGPPHRMKEQKTANDATASSQSILCATAAQGWYFIHSKNGEQPPVPAEMRYITEYGGYSVDTHHMSMEQGAEKVLYLTFDAGYENGNIEKILDVLKEEEVPGAFFILSNMITSHPELIRRMQKENHLVCNHTAHHKDMTKLDKESFQAELQSLEKQYTDTFGVPLASYYRPPEGKVSPENMQWADEMGYKTIFWSFAYADWDNDRQMAPEKAKEKILSETHNGEVLLLHPTSATNAAILRELIHAWREMGFHFGTLEELTAQDSERAENSLAAEESS